MIFVVTAKSREEIERMKTRGRLALFIVRCLQEFIPKIKQWLSERGLEFSK